MRKAMILEGFAGDGYRNLDNRAANEIVFTAFGADGQGFNAIVPGAMAILVLPPTGRQLQVTGVSRDGGAFRARLARFDDEPHIHSGTYLCSISAVVFVAGDEYTGSALATVRIDEDLPAIPRPEASEESTAGGEES